ncbi:aldo/keto reductase [Streptomyces erythrochromogenes]|uniref:aldo/keto reductase n=1 Tax=Streptomyces erythrochromogenes TaxID=285574 RepID=UPI00369EA282
MTLANIIHTPLGFGTGALGNMFREIPEDEAQATLQAAWDAGIRYYDSAPFYGAGLAEMRLGDALAGRQRDSFVLSTKVGRVVLDEMESSVDGRKGPFRHGRPNKISHDWSSEAVKRSLDDSMRRLRVDRIDIVWVHDIAQDAQGDLWLQKLEEARTGAFRVLDVLRDEGIIGAWGIGVNRTEPIEIVLSLEEPRPDGFLLGGRYTLLDHEHALQRLLPMAQEKEAEMVVGAPYNSGILAGGTHFEYQDAPPHIRENVKQIWEASTRYGVSAKAVALQFSLAHPLAVAVVPGASRPARIAEDVAAFHEEVPPALWAELRESGLISSSAPLPGGNF